MIEIIAIGGYSEVGRNMTAIKIDNEVVILDMGLHMPNYVTITESEREEVVKLNKEELRKANAIPDDRILNELKDNVVAIIPSHAHLDHIGAIPYMASKYNAPIICTNYTAAVIKCILKDEKIKVQNKIIPLPPNSSFQICENIKVEFIHTTHSVPQSAMIALHTKYGILLYTNDFKFDNSPTLGQKPNYEALKRISKQGVKAVIVDSLYAHDHKKCPSELIAKEMIRDVLLGTNTKGKGIIFTTFSSHIARLKTVTEFAKKINRKVVFMGRSLAKYIEAAEETGVAYLSKEGEVVRYSKKIGKKLKQIERSGRDKYIIIMTGHQGEPKSALMKIVNKELQFYFKPGDFIIFSCNIIPVEINIEHRRIIESKLKDLGVRIFKDVHVSGHGAREDMRELLELVKADHVIPAHSDKTTIPHFIELAEQLGYKENKTVHVLHNGDKLPLK